MSDYVKVKFNEFNRAIWAIKRKLPSGLIAYTKCTRSGDTCPNTKINVIIAARDDVMWEKPAAINLKYAELEVNDEFVG